MPSLSAHKYPFVRFQGRNSFDLDPLPEIRLRLNQQSKSYQVRLVNNLQLKASQIAYHFCWFTQHYPQLDYDS